MNTDHSTWTRVELRVQVSDGDLAADLLWSTGAAGVEERSDGAGVAMIGGFADPAESALAVERATQRGWRAALLPVTDDGLDAWRDWATPVEAGRFVLVPSWLAPPELEGATPLLLDPGRTFGSGSHPTTRLTTAMVGAADRTGQRVLDVGAGSGVLAIAAVLAGADHADAIDIDAASPTIVRSNAEANGVAGSITASCAPLAEVVAQHPPYDLVLANLLAPTVRELARDLTVATRVGGTLIVSGLLEDRWTDTLEHLPRFEVQESVAEDGWVAVSLTRIGSVGSWP